MDDQSEGMSGNEVGAAAAATLPFSLLDARCRLLLPCLRAAGTCWFLRSYGLGLLVGAVYSLTSLCS